MIQRLALLLVVFLFLSVSPLRVFSEVSYSTDSLKKERQYEALLKQLRCVVCQNQDLADSTAPLAKDMRNKVYRLVSEGKSDQDIIQFLTERYGDFILLKPPMKPLTWLLWVGPFFFVVIGLMVFCYQIIRGQRQAAEYHATRRA